MPVYAVGDVQGYFRELRTLLGRVRFSAAADQLWFVGDLVNRGPESLEVLRFARELGPAARVILGNHELHLLAVAEGVRPMRRSDTLQPIFDAPDASELLGWLRRQPLLYHDPDLGYAMVHAGIPPQWDLTEALARAREAEAWCAQNGFTDVTATIDDEPLELDPKLGAAARARVIISYFTRMRVCTPGGRLELAFKGTPEEAPPGYLPWFAHAQRRTRDVRIIFGHWAALHGHADAPNVYALDTGCSWGRTLTLMRLGDDRRFECECLSPRPGNEAGSTRDRA